MDPSDNNMDQFTSILSVTTEPEMLPLRWQEIAQCKERFIQYGEDPRNCSFMNQRVAESWIKSRENNVDPYKKTLGRSLEPDQLKVILDRNKLLIDTAFPLVKAFKPLLKISGYILSLHDKNGVLLHIDGDPDVFSLFNPNNIQTGRIYNEKTVGTTAHGLSMQYRCPVQLIGPEHYSYGFKYDISSAAPILDEEGNVICSLALIQTLKTIPWGKTLQNLQSHTLGWVTSMCVAIETQLQLKHRNNSLNIINNTLDTTISFVGEGLITIDKSNKITHINKNCAQMLRVEKEKAEGFHLEDILGEQPLVLGALNSKEPEKEIEITVGNRQFWACVKPVLNDRDEINGAVIRLQTIDKVNALVNRRFGTSAKYTFSSIIGDSAPMRKVKETARRFAQTTDSILIFGETGTGKELFAQAIHNEYRPKGPFIAINCAAMPRNLIESELFGYMGGTFTGADREGRPGKIELAHGGTLFLDEIGDMPYEIQTVLLRVLDDKRVMRLGGKQYINVDFKVIAATHKDLYKMVRKNLFRHDLYYRLSVLRINIPPLRERENDILAIAGQLIKTYCRRMGWAEMEISSRAKKRMMEYSWPGNVRQLENAIIHAINMAQDTGIIDLNHFPDEISSHSDINLPEPVEENMNMQAQDSLAGVTSVKEAEKIAIVNVLNRTGNNISMSAEILGMGKSTLYRKLKEYNISGK